MTRPHHDQVWFVGRIAFRCWQQSVIDRFLKPIWHRFVDECVIVGVVDIDPDIYRDNPWPWRRHRWIPSGWPWIDPVKEVKADTDAIDANLSTRADSLAARGLDEDEVMDQRLREKLRDVEIEAEVAKRRWELGVESVSEEDAPGEPEPATGDGRELGRI